MGTNREKLNKMSNEEFARFFAYQDCRYCAFQQMDCYKRDDYHCKDGILQWLNQEIESEE